MCGAPLETTAQEYVTVKRLSQLIDTPEPTIRDWVHDGKIPYQKLPTGGIRFKIAVIRRWMETNTVNPVANRLIKV